LPSSGNCLTMALKK